MASDRWHDERIKEGFARAERDREEIRDELDSKLMPLAALPVEVAKHATKIEALEKGQVHMRENIGKLFDRDAGYRRNVVIALGPLTVAAVGLVAKAVFGIDLPGAGGGR